MVRTWAASLCNRSLVRPTDEGGRGGAGEVNNCSLMQRHGHSMIMGSAGQTKYRTNTNTARTQLHEISTLTHRIHYNTPSLPSLSLSLLAVPLSRLRQATACVCMGVDHAHLQEFTRRGNKQEEHNGHIRRSCDRGSAGEAHAGAGLLQFLRL